MIIVDTHAHTSSYLVEPVEVLLFQMNMNKVDKTALVQRLTQTGEKDNRYLFECVRRFPGRFSPVVMIDTGRLDAPKILKQWAKEGAEGVRLKVATRSPGKDPLAIWKTAANLGLPVSCQGNEEDFSNDEFLKLINKLPDLTFIIEHLGHVEPDEAAPYSRFKKILNLSKFPNVFIKMGGLGEICKRPYPFQEPFYAVHSVPPFIKMAYKSFGPSRMMWGSNYPMSSPLEGYRNTLYYLEEHLDTFCTKEDKQWILGKTALSLYKFN
jgi:L-fuconolactonase